jgi:hypothetical protein
MGTSMNNITVPLSVWGISDPSIAMFENDVHMKIFALKVGRNECIWK